MISNEMFFKLNQEEIALIERSLRAFFEDARSNGISKHNAGINELLLKLSGEEGR